MPVPNLRAGAVPHASQQPLNLTSMPYKSFQPPISVLTGRNPMRPCDIALAARRIKSGNTTVQARLDEMLALQYEAEEITASVRDQERRMYNKHHTAPTRSATL
eukprot:COSAG01_NODE_3427_length_6093_cov_9.704943_8_plen_104_part_00